MTRAIKNRIIHFCAATLGTLFTMMVVFNTPVAAQTGDGFPVEQFFKASGSPVNPKVPVSWNRYYTNEGLYDIYQKLVKAYPGLIRLESIGKSYEKRDIWLLTVTNFNNKSHEEKPGFWIDGNIHANEVQGSEIALYTAWYLLENYNKLAFITELLDDKVFYIAPTINPDGRAHYMREPNTASSPRSGTIPLDDDGDGAYAEDGYTDLNGDGHITQMRRRNPLGNLRSDPDDPRRMIPAKPGEFGEWEMLGMEGLDQDGDGRVGEDRIGYYDPNRDWGWNWQPDYVQRGAFTYPFALPENRAVLDFVMAHPNIAGAQTYHNTGGMILRGPGTREDDALYTRDDRLVYDAIGELGDRMLPGYKYMTLFEDLYTVYGGQIDWFHFGRGIFTFTNELFTRYLYFNKEYGGGRMEGQDDIMFFDKYLLFEESFVDWHDYDHPQYGKIQIGGFKKNTVRVNPGFMLEQDAHRNMAFTLHHAYHTPKLEIREITVNDMGGGLREVNALIANTRLIPTHSGIDLQFRIERPNYVSLEGANVLAGMIVANPDLNIVTEQKVNPAVIEVSNIPGMSAVRLKWIIEGGRRITIRVDSPKGGVVSSQL